MHTACNLEIKSQKFNYSLEVHRQHVCENPAPDGVAQIGHGPVLDGPREGGNVPRLASGLQLVPVKVLHVVGVGRHVVRVGPDGGAAVLHCELGQADDKVQSLEERNWGEMCLHYLRECCYHGSGKVHGLRMVGH